MYAVHCTVPYMKSLHWLPIEQRIKYKALMIMYNDIHNDYPDYITSLITIRQQSSRATIGFIVETPSKYKLTSTLTTCLAHIYIVLVEFTTMCTTFRKMLSLL